MALSVLREATMTFSELARRRLRAMVTDGGSSRTGISYDEAYGLFKEYLHAQGLKDDVREFTSENVEGFKEWYARRPGVTKISSVTNRLAALASLGKWGMQHGQGKERYLSLNPVDSVSRPKKQRPKERYLYADELRALLAVDALPNERLALAFLMDTRLRASAAATATVKDLSLNGENVVLTVTEKGNLTRTVVLSPQVAGALLASLKEREAGSGETLLVNAAGRPYTRTSLSEMIARLARKAGITRFPVRAHLFARHSPASLAGQGGATEFEIAAMLGHSDTSTARRYVHGVTGDRARALVQEALRG